MIERAYGSLMNTLKYFGYSLACVVLIPFQASMLADAWRQDRGVMVAWMVLAMIITVVCMVSEAERGYHRRQDAIADAMRRHPAGGRGTL